MKDNNFNPKPIENDKEFNSNKKISSQESDD